MIDSHYYRPIWVLENETTHTKRLVMKCNVLCPLYSHQGKAKEIKLFHKGYSNKWEAIDIPQTKAKKLKLLVIAPGMGLTLIPNRLTELKNRYDVHVLDGFPEGYGPSMGYPPGWQSGAPEIIEGQCDLATLSRQVIYQIKHIKPDVVLCGSRGGQVTIGLVWKAMNKGLIPVIPTIVLNAGCVIVPGESIPTELKLVLVTGGLDYFGNTSKTRDFVAKHKKEGRNTYHFHSTNSNHSLSPYFEDNVDSIIKQATVSVSEKKSTSADKIVMSTYVTRKLGF